MTQTHHPPLPAIPPIQHPDLERSLDLDALDDRFIALLEAGDEALAAGSPWDPSDLPDVPSELIPQLRDARDCLQLLGELWPSTGESKDRTIAEDAQRPDPIRFDAESATPRVGRFELCGELGRGGMGVVYRAFQPDLSRSVALKMILAGAHASDRQRAQFLREARLAAGLRHPNIVQVYEVGEQRDCPYIVLEYMDGGSLARRLKQTKPTFRESAQLLETLARAVHFAHQSGVVHRDLKPANILLQRKQGLPLNAAALPQPTLDGQSLLDAWHAKIADFGLAREFDTDATATGQVAGTPSYMAPEQAEGRKEEQKPPVDIYGLGAILYELLTGRPPFKADSAAKTIELVKRTDPVPPRQLRPDVPRDLENICLKCLEKKPADRYASAAELADDLARFQRDEPVQARPPGLARRLVRGLRRHGLVASLVCVLLGGVALAMLQDPYRDSRELARVTAQLADRKPVTLIGKQGGPKWAAWRRGREATQTSIGKDGHFDVHSWALCLFELLPSVPVEKYTVKVEVCHRGSNRSGEVGIYLAHQSWAGERTRSHLVLPFTFHDLVNMARDAKLRLPEHLAKRVPEGPLNAARLDPRIFFDGRDGIHRAGLIRGGKFEPALNARTWRTLEVRVTPDALQASFDGNPLPPLPAAKIIDQLKSWNADLAKNPAAFPPDPPAIPLPEAFNGQAALGIYVSDSSASFRAFTVSPH